VNVIEGKKSSIHAAFLKVTSGQLRFLGSSIAARDTPPGQTGHSPILACGPAGHSRSLF
jgi:hypothetical protein